MARVKRVGFLVATTPNDWKRYIQWFEAKLKRLNPNVEIHYEPPGGADGDAATIMETAAYLAKYTDVVITAGTGAALALKTATQDNRTPFVFASIGDPGLSGLTPQPGGNFTGGNNLQVALVGDRVRHMQANPDFKPPFAVVGNYQNEPARTAMTLACNALNAYPASISPGDDIGAFIAQLQNMGIKSLYVCSDLYLTAHSKELNQAAHRARMKTMFEFEEHHLQHGGDDYYGVSFKDLFEKAAEYVHQLLGSSKKAAGDMPLFTTQHRGGLTKKPKHAAPKKKKGGRGR
jgi:ABC-type uncharacterized transport system substrate-binding protein